MDLLNYELKAPDLDISPPKRLTYVNALNTNIWTYIPGNLTVRVFANGSGDQSSIPGRVVPKTQKMVLDPSLHYKVRIKGKVEQSRERSSALPYTLV